MKRSLSHIVRKMLGLHHNSRIPIKVCEGSSSPMLRGESFYYTTPSGKTRIRHPNAYARAGKNGFNRTMYHRSTQLITVGADYLLRLSVNQ